jgi:hypothetical protein
MVADPRGKRSAAIQGYQKAFTEVSSIHPGSDREE